MGEVRHPIFKKYRRALPQWTAFPKNLASTSAGSEWFGDGWRGRGLHYLFKGREQKRLDKRYCNKLVWTT